MSHSIKKLKKGSVPSEYRLWYNEWIEKNAKGEVLDIGKSQFWDYGFPTLDTDVTLCPTFHGSIERAPFPAHSFDTVLCNGMYEFVKDPQQMIQETLAILKPGGTAIFGFVGEGYKPYRKPWKFYKGERLPNEVERKDFGNEYHFIICKKV